MNNMLLWMLSNPSGSGLVNADEVNELWETITQVIEIVVWVIMAALGVVLVVKGITTALAVVKAADEPQVRQEKIGSFKFMAIGIVIALVILLTFNTLLSIFGEDIGSKFNGLS